MLSKATHHYPQFVFRDGEKLLWNPILKKAFKNRPEERVRLQLLEYLTEEANFSPSRISFEAPVNLPRDKSSSRTDLICYGKDFEPILLVECKAPEIQLTEKAAIQIARYNQKVNAPFLLISNGIQDYWFAIEGEQLSALETLPPLFQSKQNPTLDFSYWAKRGFAGSKSHPNSRKWILESCNKLFAQNTPERIKFFSFEGSDPNLALPNFYYIYSHSPKQKLAISFCGTPYSSTKLSVILNENGQNTALLSCSLDLLADEEPQNTLLQSKDGLFQLDLAERIDLDLGFPITEYFSKFIEIFSE